jgi:hypothetical protein
MPEGETWLEMLLDGEEDEDILSVVREALAGLKGNRPSSC